jgi:hypothetical protein
LPSQSRHWASAFPGRVQATVDSQLLSQPIVIMCSRSFLYELRVIALAGSTESPTEIKVPAGDIGINFRRHQRAGGGVKVSEEKGNRLRPAGMPKYIGSVSLSRKPAFRCRDEELDPSNPSLPHNSGWFRRFAAIGGRAAGIDDLSL